MTNLMIGWILEQSMVLKFDENMSRKIFAISTRFTRLKSLKYLKNDYEQEFFVKSTIISAL